MTNSTAQVMYATGPLTTVDGDLLNFAPSRPVERAAIVVRCVGSDGTDLAAPITLSTAAAREALAEIVGDRAAGEVDADRFARHASRAVCDWQDAHGRGRLIFRHIHKLELLAMTAVKRDVPGIVAWAPEGA